MEFNTDKLCFEHPSDMDSPFYASDAYIESLEILDDYVFYKEHDQEFNYYEQHLGNSACSRIGSGLFGNGRIGSGRDKKSSKDRYTKLKCSPDEQIRYAQKMAVKRVNALKKKENDMYARNRRDARSAVLQETTKPVQDEVDTIVKDSYWVMDDDDREVDWIEKELLRCQYGAVVYQHLFGWPLKEVVDTNGIDTYHYCYI
uniref:Uncharacterized protein n=1 Tax=viral metagenome TaxID=1070528 RepID=A0A6C0HH97_9ZZZZ